MRNLSVLRDAVQVLPAGTAGSGDITSVAYDSGLSTLLVLTATGCLHALELCDENNSDYSNDMLMIPGLLTSSSNAVWNLNVEKEFDNGWFYLSILAETGDIACISRSGSIASIKAEIGSGCGWSKEISIEGDVDNGIAHAQWSPDQTVLVVITNNNSLLSITSSWDVLSEIPLEPRLESSPASLSWRADGEFFSLVSTDREDGFTRLRVYNRDMELTAVGRNVAEGAGKLVRGLGCVTAFGSNGSLVAVPQERTAGHLLIAFLERNGLRHSDLEVRCPVVPDRYNGWRVVKLFWDLPSQLLAVELQATAHDGSISQGVVQLYHRNNYHWYLKKHWSAVGLTCLGFDSEVVDRLYLAQSNVTTFGSSACSDAIRIIDVHWESQSCCSPDCTTAVVDGNALLLTPLGIAVTPPPMSRHKITLRGPCIHLSFWSRGDCADNQWLRWGLAALCDDFKIALLLSDEEGGGGIKSHIELDLAREITELAGGASPLVSLHPRALGASQVNEQLLAVAVLCCSTQHIGAKATSSAASASSDVIIIVHVDIAARKITTASFLSGIAGVCTRLSPWPSRDELPSIAVGVSNGCAFEVLRLSLAVDPTVGAGDRSGVGSFATRSFNERLLPLPLPLILPETCPQFTVLSSSDGESCSVIGLSSKNRLYYDECLLVVGASSFCLNSPLGVLMYTSVGTRPHLHFISTAQLPSAAAADSQPSECAAARPVERGARIVSCVPGDPRVIIQLPRGNLECFEPRPLTLKRVRSLIEAKKLVECLRLMRRQRIDMNYLVDFDQELFFAEIQPMCKAAAAENPELLSLLVSSLDATDAAARRYDDPLPPGSSPGRGCGLSGEAKVNGVCSALREALLPLLLAGQASALNPLLCTYAKQRPPMLGEALRLLRDLCSAHVGAAASINQQQMQAAIKYLAFLQDGALLFDAALGNCDFELAKAVARQCQMDPKAFMPLISSFEAVGKGGKDGSPRYCLMHHGVNKHLKRYEKAVDFALQCLQAIGAVDAESCDLNDDDDDAIDVSALSADTLSIVTANTLFEYAMPMLFKACSTAVVPSVKAALETLSSQMRHAFGLHCTARGRYRDASAAFLSEQPPSHEHAARACRLEGNWREALLIASRYGAPTAAQAMAREIVASYREGLELGASELKFSADSSGIEGEAAFYTPYNDRSVEVANICLDYCNDIEGCVGILLLSQKWTDALQAAVRGGRGDLLHDEVAPAARAAATELQSLLSSRNEKIVEYAAELGRLWADPVDRLNKVASTDPTLLAELSGVSAAEVDETKSEFSALTMQSGASFTSDMSSASKRSTSSTVSVLSTLSLDSRQSSASAVSTSSFGIEGLAHSLLSRGGKKDLLHAEPKELHGKRLKREHKNRVRGRGRDVWGLRRELQMAEEMWDFACVEGVARAVRDLLDLFLLLGGKAELAAASELQRAMDAHAALLQSQPAPIAPAYPPEWLSKRFMGKIRHFQEQGVTAAAYSEATEGGAWDSQERVERGAVLTWWMAAANGIKVWLKFKRVVLN